jgi:hypothetical protein
MHFSKSWYCRTVVTRFRWRLKTRDREEADAIMEPVRSARAQMRKAVEEWGACELGTSASVAAEARPFAAQRSGVIVVILILFGLRHH